MLLHRLLLSGILAGLISVALACDDSDSSKRVEKLFSAQANELDVYDLTTGDKTVLIPAERNNVNGQICAVPHTDGHFLMGEDTDQKNDARQGWAEFDAEGVLVKKYVEPEAPNEPDQPEPYGCAFDSEDRLFTSDIGDTNFDSTNGKLVLFFPPGYQKSCILAPDIRVAGMIALDDDGSVLLTESVPPGRVLRFSAPFPKDDSECDSVKPAKATFIEDPDMGTPLGITRAPNGNWYVSSVFVLPAIREYDHNGTFVRTIIDGADIGNPAGIAIDSDGTIYYADLAIVNNNGDIGPEAGKGTVRKVEFDSDGNPQTPVIIASGYDYPDGVAVLTVK